MINRRAAASFVDGVGMLAAATGIAASVPKMHRIARTRDVHSFSSVSVTCSLVSSLLWLWFGTTLGLVPTVLSAAVGVACNGCILILKSKARQSPQP